MIANFNGFHIDTIQLEDAKSIHKLMAANIDRFQRYFPGTLKQNLTESLSETFTKSKVGKSQAKEEYLFTIKENTTNHVAGIVYIKELDWVIKQGEFAYCVGSEYGGKQLMSNSIKALSQHAFTILGLEVLQIISHKDNTPSVKVALNNNFKWIKTLLNEFTPAGENPLDMELYELYKN